MKAVGIDLGTTNSLVAFVQNGHAQIIDVDGGKSTLPSAVQYREEGDILVGRAARDAAADAVSRTILSVKRLLGRTAEETQKLGFGDARIKQDGALLRIDLGQQQPTPVEVSAEILKELKRYASDALGGEISKAVITVPAYFDDTQRQATRQAGRLAGLEVLRLVNEPTAAALAYGLDKRTEGRFAIFDLGGGTFDISILHLVDGVFEVLSTGGDSQLGGDDFDSSFAKVLLDRFSLAETAVSQAFKQRLLMVAEAAKIELTTHFEAQVEIEDETGTEHCLTISRAQYEAIVEPTLRRVIPPCQRAFRDAGIRPEQLDGVVLVGGSTRSPFVHRFVADLFERQPLSDIDPDEVVALGAASQADLLSAESELRLIDGGDVLLLDVTPLSVGLEMMGGLVEKVIPRCSQIPASRSQEFTTYQDGQTAMDIHVLQGERELVADCRSLARFQLRGIPPKPAGVARIRVNFQIDADSILTVSAEELSTGIQQQVIVQPSHGLTDEQIEDMLQASLDHAEADVNARFLRTAVVEAERALLAMKAAIRADKDLLTEDEADVIAGVISDLEQAMHGTDHRLVQDLTDMLDKVSSGFAHRRMERALQVGLKDVSIDHLEQELETEEQGEE
ncbi:MAG: Fe-S protein assembly chaperone HscA [Myxococcales bacterium]|nr:Fe-S protein assembly chaperone HscA [Myxococcales bacterium]